MRINLCYKLRGKKGSCEAIKCRYNYFKADYYFCMKYTCVSIHVYVFKSRKTIKGTVTDNINCVFAENKQTNWKIKGYLSRRTSHLRQYIVDIFFFFFFDMKRHNYLPTINWHDKLVNFGIDWCFVRYSDYLLKVSTWF